MLGKEPTQEEVAGLLVYAHHRLVAIHPFTNGNGCMARLFTNLLAYNYGYQEVVMYQRQQGDARTRYLQAIRQANHYDLAPWLQLVSNQLRPH